MKTSFEVKSREDGDPLQLVEDIPNEWYGVGTFLRDFVESCEVDAEAWALRGMEKSWV